MKLTYWFKMALAALALALGAPLAASAVDCITDVMLVGGSKSETASLTNSYAAQGWRAYTQDLNSGCGSGSDYIYLLYKSADSASVSNGTITGFYIKTGSSGVTDEITHGGRLYRLAPYDGGGHFKEQKGDLNSNAGGAAIHLYYTKSAFPDSRAVTGITFNATLDGAVGANGGTEGCDLNDECGGNTDYIYMHVATGTGLYVPPVAVTDVVARQRWPWNGLVDITCTVSGTEWTDGSQDFVVAAVMEDSSVRNATHFWVMRGGEKSASRNVSTNGDYRLLWDAGADLGTGGIHSNVAVRVTAQRHARVQLWKDGPYWATTNVGAEKPEDSGYYFWWGDTIGYKREGDAWVANDGSTSSFSFSGGNVPTYGMDNSALQSAGYIDSTGNLAPEHDAAQVHWGGKWRMPTKQELDDLVNKCDWEWTTVNGVQGYAVSGKYPYDSARIFLPAVGYGGGTSLYDAGSYGSYWSSVPYSGSRARSLDFDSGRHDTSYYSRYFGQSVRPVQGFTE